MDVMDTGEQSTQENYFLISLFEFDGKSDDASLHYAEAIEDVQKLKHNVSNETLQSNITEIITKFALQSRGSSRKNGDGCDLSTQLGFKLMGRAVGSREEEVVDFLLATFVRCNRELMKEDLSESSKSLITATSQSVLSVTTTLLRGYLNDSLQQKYIHLVFLKRLLEDTISSSFVQQLVQFTANSEDPEEIDEVFTPIIDLLRSAIIAQSIEENKDEVVQHILRVMTVLLSVKINNSRPICGLVIRRSDYLPNEGCKVVGREYGTITFLGPFFNYGLISSGRRPNTRVFENSEDDAVKNDGSVNLEQKTFFMKIETYRRMVHQLMIPLLSDQSSRAPTVRWLAKIVGCNQKRTRTHFETGEVVCDHFMANFLAVMYALSEKIELSKIEARYPFLPGSLVNITKETRLKMNEASANAFALQFADRSADAENFSTECFFITISAQQLVYPSYMTQISDYTRHIKDLKVKIAGLQANLAHDMDATVRQEMERKLKTESENWKMLSRHLLCLKTLAQDPNLISASLRFSDKQVTMMINALCPTMDLMGDFSQLPEEATPLFSAYPEHYLEDIFEFYTFCLSNAVPMLMERNADWIGRLCILFCKYNYINNPFLVAKLVRVITGIQPPLWNHLMAFRMTQERLLPAMIKFYSDFEDNGDFYEKFNVRGNIQYMLEKMDEDVFYKSKFMEMARECGSEFIRFVNMVINDATWCIDESLSGLKSIHDVEKKMASQEEWGRLDEEQRNQELGVYEEAKRKVKGWLGTAKGNLKLLNSITDNSPEPFRTAVLGERLAAMLNHNLSQLMGNKCVELKVRDASSYGWHPRKFVTLLISIYLGLNVESFIKYIAYDERTYNPEFFRQAIERMKNSQIVSNSQLERFEHLAEAVQKVYEEKAELEEEYDDVPEEFKDPIMDAIMINPVKLPSGHIMDRAVIERHLLSTPNNPFSRAPLTQAELVDDVELKAKIQTWIAAKRSAKK